MRKPSGIDTLDTSLVPDLNRQLINEFDKQLLTDCRDVSLELFFVEFVGVGDVVGLLCIDFAIGGRVVIDTKTYKPCTELRLVATHREPLQPTKFLELRPSHISRHDILVIATYLVVTHDLL